MPSVRENVGAAVLLLVAVGCADGSDDGGDTDEASASESSAGEPGASDTGVTSSGGDASWPSLAERPCPPDSALTWENFGGAYVLGYCTSCHHGDLPADARQLAPVAVDLETVELVRTHASRVWARAADQNQSMPPIGAPGPDERALLGEWLACGAPTNADLADE